MGHLDNIGFINGVLTQQSETILSVEPNDAYFNYEAISSSHTVSATHQWELESKPNWLSVSPSSGSAGNTTITLSRLSYPQFPQVDNVVLRLVGYLDVKAYIRVVWNPL